MVETPPQYLLPRGVERAAALLRNTERTIVEISFDVGLTSLGSFTTSFGRVYGMPPTADRAAHPPASVHARVPAWVLQAHARPYSSCREDCEPGRDSRVPQFIE